MPTIKRDMGSGQSFVDSFSQPDDLRSILVSISKKLDELIAWANTHTHAAGAVPDQSVSISDIEVEE